MEKENFCAKKEKKKETAKEEEENTFGKEKCCPGNGKTKKEGFVKNPCRPKTVLSKKYDNVWSF